MAADSYLGMMGILEEEVKEGANLDAIEETSQYFFSGKFDNKCSSNVILQLLQRKKKSKTTKQSEVL